MTRTSFGAQHVTSVLLPQAMHTLLPIVKAATRTEKCTAPVSVFEHQNAGFVNFDCEFRAFWRGRTIHVCFFASADTAVNGRKKTSIEQLEED